MQIEVDELYSDVWTLDDGVFSPQHDSWRVETVEVDTMSNGEHSTYNTRVAICNDIDCESEVDVDPQALYERPDDE